MTVDTVGTIVSSPYSDHLLQLSSLEPEYQISALALQNFHSVSPNYATDNYLDSFNIADVVALIRGSALRNRTKPPEELYVIAFRSVLKPDVRGDPQKIKVLHDFDEKSHAEANESGGLLKYWYGVADPVSGHNLATCWWRSAEDARRGGTGKLHRESIAKTRDWYSLWKVEQYVLRIGEGDWQLAAF